MGDRIDGRGWSPIPLTMIQNSNPLTGVVSSALVLNATYLKGLIDDADSYGMESRFGHTHQGGITGAPINRMIGNLPNHTDALWSFDDNISGWDEITSNNYDIFFSVPKGIDQAAISICYDLTNQKAGDKLGISRGEETPTTLVQPGAAVSDRVWSADINISLRQGSINKFKLWIYKNGSNQITSNIYGMRITENTTIT